MLFDDSRQGAYLEILHHGLLSIRNSAWSKRAELCGIEADHLHNIPSLFDEANEARHLYYIDAERAGYLESLQRLGMTEYLKSSHRNYDEPWRILASAVGFEL